MGLDIGLDAFGTRASRRDRERIGAERFECFYDMEGIVVFEHPGDVLSGITVALAILIFMAQLPQFVGANWLMYALVAVTLIERVGLELKGAH